MPYGPRRRAVASEMPSGDITASQCSSVTRPRTSAAVRSALAGPSSATTVGAYHRCVADTVGRFGGFVAKYMGDSVLAYFGYPEAHEDDAERAARAGLAVIATRSADSPHPSR
jgi:class 3 adenylate cyclase